MTPTVCTGCGQVQGVEEYDEALWEIYERIDDGRSTWEPLVYTQDDLDEAGYPDEDSVEAIKLSMEKNMGERGLCPACGRPDLSRIESNQIMDEETARDMHEMWSEQEAERRMGA